MIRGAKISDFYPLLQICEKFHKMSQLPCNFDHAAMCETFSRLIEDDNSCLFLSEGGTIGGTITNPYCDPNYKIAVELFWFADDKQGLPLLRAFERWAKSKQANEIRMSTLSNIPKSAKLLSLLGYKPTEISHTRQV